MGLQLTTITIVADLQLVDIVHVVATIIVIALLLLAAMTTMAVVVSVIGLLPAVFVVLLLTTPIRLLVATVAKILMWLHHRGDTMSLTPLDTTDHQGLELLQEPMVEGTMRDHVIGRLSSPYHGSPIGKHAFWQTWLIGLDCYPSPFLTSTKTYAVEGFTIGGMRGLLVKIEFWMQETTVQGFGLGMVVRQRQNCRTIKSCGWAMPLLISSS